MGTGNGSGGSGSGGGGSGTGVGARSILELAKEAEVKMVPSQYPVKNWCTSAATLFEKVEFVCFFCCCCLWLFIWVVIISY